MPGAIVVVTTWQGVLLASSGQEARDAGKQTTIQKTASLRTNF